MKLLIADDDINIRTGIREGVDWAALGFSEVFAAENGVEALALFRLHWPDIVITDIRMPGLSGLELLEQMKSLNPLCKTIILSGFSEFDYMKRAIQLGVADYELKPVNARKLLRLIEKVQQELLQGRTDREEYAIYRESHKKAFFEDVISGKIADRNIILSGFDEYFGFDLKGPMCFTLLAPDLDRDGGEDVPGERAWMKEADGLLTGLGKPGENFMLQLVFREGLAVLYKEVNSTLLLLSRTEAVCGLMHRFIAAVRARSGLSLSAGVSGFGDSAALPALYEKAERALSARFYHGPASVTLYTPEAEHTAPALDEDALRAAFSLGEEQGVERAIGQAFAGLQARKAQDTEAVAFAALRMVEVLASALAAALSTSAGEAEKALDFDRTVPRFPYLDAYQAWVLAHCRQAFRAREELLAHNRNPVVAKALLYIHNHFSEDISCEQVAGEVNKTPNYFCHLFKRDMGISYSDYLNRLRLERAKKRITDSDDILLEIATQAGYRNYNYFAARFKQLFGVAPSELRRGKGAEPSPAETKIP